MSVDNVEVLGALETGGDELSSGEGVFWPRGRKSASSLTTADEILGEEATDGLGAAIGMGGTRTFRGSCRPHDMRLQSILAARVVLIPRCVYIHRAQGFVARRSRDAMAILFMSDID